MRLPTKGAARQEYVLASVAKQSVGDARGFQCVEGVSRVRPGVREALGPEDFAWMVVLRGCHKDAHPFFFLLWHPLSDVWWLPTNRHRLPTNRHRLPTNRHWLHTNRHRLPTNRHRLPTGRHRIGHSEFFFFFHYGTPWWCFCS